MKPRNAPLRRVRAESLAATRTPYTAQVSEHVVRTTSGDFVQVFRLSGVSFQTADDDEINLRHAQLNMLWRSLASTNLALWTHIVRERSAEYPGGEPHSEFARRLNDRYRLRVMGEQLMQNTLYLSLVYRPAVDVATSGTARLFARGSSAGNAQVLHEALEACDKLADTVRATLCAYEPQRLGLYHRSGRAYSTLLEFLSFLVNGEWQPMPLARAPLNEVLATTRPCFGTETVEYRAPTRSTFGAVVGIKEYATPTVAGQFDALLSAPFPLTLTQSFTFLSKATAQALMLRQHRRLTNAGDYGVSQAEELYEALDALTANEFVLGDHHLTLQVFSDSFEASDSSASGGRLKQLNERVGIARRFLADTGMVVAREDLALEAAVWAQLPGAFMFRPRKAPITSRNFAGLSPFHSFPVGRAHGNHWGEALTVLMSAARSPYYFSLHASDPADPDGGSRKDIGHTLIIGPTGSGKTVFVGFLMCMMQKFGVVQIIIDKDRGLEMLTRALGGDYRVLEEGVPTGFNPLQLEPTPANLEFLRTWIRVLVRGPDGWVMGAREETDLDHALLGTLALEPGARRLSRLIEFLDATQREGVYARLSQWCESTQGAQKGVFDNPHDEVVAQLSQSHLFGFDVTTLLNNALTRTPVTLYLFHLIGLSVNGQRLVCWCDEFSRLLDDPAFSAFAKNSLKTWRKQGGVLVAATQSASDALASTISRTVIEQTATKVLFPHGDAVASEYIDGLGLTEREFDCVRNIAPGSRQFLVKQGQHSVVCELSLKGFDPELAVISGRTSSVKHMHQLMELHGPDPGAWLPYFLREFSKEG